MSVNWWIEYWLWHLKSIRIATDIPVINFNIIRALESKISEKKMLCGGFCWFIGILWWIPIIRIESIFMKKFFFLYTFFPLFLFQPNCLFRIFVWYFWRWYDPFDWRWWGWWWHLIVIRDVKHIGRHRHYTRIHGEETSFAVCRHSFISFIKLQRAM